MTLVEYLQQVERAGLVARLTLVNGETVAGRVVVQDDYVEIDDRPLGAEGTVRVSFGHIVTARPLGYS